MELRERQKNEAIARMAAWHISPQIIRDFGEGVVSQSENGGFLYWIDDEVKEIVERFEKEFGGLVYHVIRNDTSIGTLFALLYVSKYPEEWDRDNQDIEEGYPMAWVENMDVPMFSEFGHIEVRRNIGGLVRTA